eukprot:gene27231-30054_t
MFYDCATDKLKSKLRIEIDKSFAKFESYASTLSEYEKSLIFEELFKVFMDSVKKEYPATSADIDKKIFRVLAQVKSIDSTSTNFLKTLSDYASIAWSKFITVEGDEQILEKKSKEIERAIRSNLEHVAMYSDGVVTESTQKTFPTFVEAFFDSAKSLFALAAMEAKCVQKKGRTEKFLNSLHALLVNLLPDLEMLLPTYGESYADCDENDVKIFHDLWKNIGIDSVTIDEEFNDSVVDRILVDLK